MLKKGSRICYTVLDGTYAYFTAVILTPERPKIPTNKILNITASDGKLRFITALAGKTEISFGEEDFCEKKDILRVRDMYALPIISQRCKIYVKMQ